MGELISKDFQKYPIGNVIISEMFEFTPKFISKGDQFFLYYAEHGETDKLIEYNCTNQLKKYLLTKKYHILSISVGEEIICVLEDKQTQRKLIAQVVNGSFDDKEM